MTTNAATTQGKKKWLLRLNLNKRLSKRYKGDTYKVSFPTTKSHQGQNNIRTTKYTLLTFLPKNLAFQFGRYYNLYFLVGALSVLLGYSSLSAASQIAPLVIVLAFSAAKEAIEDFNRYRADSLANNTPVVTVENGSKVSKASKNLQPGDIVYVEKGAKFYVDVALLSSSYEDGTVFIETAELDGETNLKRKSALQATVHLNNDSVSFTNGVIECETPNENLISFEGRLTTEGKTTPISMLNFVPRGSVLRNTEFIYGVVIYSGLNTKIMKNLKKGKIKSSRLEASLNKLVLAAFVFNLVLLVSSVVLDYISYRDYLSQESLSDINGDPFHWYLQYQQPNTGTRLFSTIVSFFVLYSYVIPISLFVSIEMVRLGQATFMVWDPKMKYARQNIDGSVSHIPMRANNSNLNEELGCIDYIFSDKTGTLTQNSMKMYNWFVGGEVYNEMENPGVLGKVLENIESLPQRKEQIGMMLTALATCHGVIPSLDEKTGKMVYESQSPDETALLEAAEANNYKLVKRTKQAMEVEILGSKKSFEILGTVEFNSTRKRMSIIVKNDDGIRVYCKGADNIMMSRLDKETNDPNLLKKVDESLIEFSNIGLRTLVVAYRQLTNEEYENFKKQYDEAEISLENREMLIDEASDLVETNLKLIGCTAIEDKLQDRVPETIENLLKADIKFWLLTGDKQETAINIGMSSKLITRAMKLFILDGNSPAEVITALGKISNEMESSPPSQIFALVVNGSVLSQVFVGEKESKDKFLSIGKKCKTVICSRVTPLQKALVVRLVKQSLTDSITLAIGDGANDVSMIQEAHVGIGIMGKEGTQAVRAADFAFGEFRFLERLLMVHGRFNMLRFCNMILYSFYKNLVFITIQWLFGFFNMWSGQTVYEEIFFISYNLFFTSLPPIIYGLYEKDIPESYIERFPQLYQEVKTGLYWNTWIIFKWFVTGVFHAVIIFGTVFFVNYEGAADSLGRSTGYWVQCYLLSTPLLLVVLFKKAIISRLWIWINAAGFLLSFGLSIALMFLLIFLDWYSYSDFGTAALLHVLYSYYLLCIVVPILCLAPEILANYFEQLYKPKDNDIVAEHVAIKGSVI